jgi:hypothetical protein
MNRQDAKFAKKNKREEEEKKQGGADSATWVFLSLLFSSPVFLANLASWRFVPASPCPHRLRLG